MKKLLLTMTIASLMLGACKKDKIEEGPEYKGNVEYIIRCNECTATLDVAAGTKVVNVKGEASVWDTNQLKTINVLTVGQGDSEVNIRINELTVYFATKSMNATGKATHSVTVAR